MKRIRFGLIGCGLMGREFASAAARWCHLLKPDARPEIVAACDANAGALDKSGQGNHADALMLLASLEIHLKAQGETGP